MPSTKPGAACREFPKKPCILSVIMTGATFALLQVVRSTCVGLAGSACAADHLSAKPSALAVSVKTTESIFSGRSSAEKAPQKMTIEAASAISGEGDSFTVTNKSRATGTCHHASFLTWHGESGRGYLPLALPPRSRWSCAEGVVNQPTRPHPDTGRRDTHTARSRRLTLSLTQTHRTPRAHRHIRTLPSSTACAPSNRTHTRYMQPSRVSQPHTVVRGRQPQQRDSTHNRHTPLCPPAA